MSSKARKEIYAATEDAEAAYFANGKKDYDAGFFNGLTAALEILDRHESRERDFLSQALNEGDGSYKP